MAQTKTSTVVDKTRPTAWGDNLMGNNSALSEWKGNFRLSQPIPVLAFFLATFCFSLSRQQTAC